MTSRNLPADLPARFRAAGLKVVEIPGWQTRGRPASTGAFNPVGVLNHHTGDTASGKTYAAGILVRGRSDLAGPLCHLSLGRDGTVYVIAAGRANHAGVAKPVGSVAGGDGNELYVGIEWQLTGLEPIPAVMYNAGATLNAVLLDVLGSTEQTVHCHYETSVTGKWDIGDPNGINWNGKRVLDVAKFAARVKTKRAALHAKPTPVVAPTPGTKPQRLWGDSFFHVPKGVPYFVENSVRGVRQARRLRLAKLRRRFRYAIDLDLQITKDGVVVATHWAKPLENGFVDPLGLLAKSTPIHAMTWGEVSRLVARYDGQTYKIRKAVDLIALCLKFGLGVEIELKTDGFARRVKVVDAFVAEIKALPRYSPGRVWAKSLTSVPARCGQRLQAFSSRGIPALLLSHDNRLLPASWKPGAGMVDDVRGSARWAA